MSESAPTNNKVVEELARLRSLDSGGNIITMRDNLTSYLSGRKFPGEIRNMPHYAALDRIYREFTDAEIYELIRGLV